VNVICTTTGGQHRYGLVWAIVINLPELTKLDTMHIFQAQVCGCISSHPGLSHQKTKWETSDASKSQLSQASWNRTALEFGSEIKLKIPKYLSIHICDYPLIARSGKSHVTISLIVHPAHLEYRSLPLVLKDVRISGIWRRKNQWWSLETVSISKLVSRPIVRVSVSKATGLGHKPIVLRLRIWLSKISVIQLVFFHCCICR